MEIYANVIKGHFIMQFKGVKVVQLLIADFVILWIDAFNVMTVMLLNQTSVLNVVKAIA